MKANELRIGNYFLLPNGKISKISYHEIRLLVIAVVKPPYKPIPLTGEWLIKFGFVKRAETFYGIRIKPAHWLEISLKTKRIIIFHKGGFVGLNYKKYAHELQNLYFSLCGEELKASSENPEL